MGTTTLLSSYACATPRYFVLKLVILISLTLQPYSSLTLPPEHFAVYIDINNNLINNNLIKFINKSTNYFTYNPTNLIII